MYTSSEPNLTAHAESNNANGALAKSGVSWGAIFAGATAAAALSLILLVLGTGLGMSSISPWSQDGISATTFGVSTIIWVTLMAIASSGMGGYLAGRLRTKWVGIHTDEVFFRDTAHGFLAWCVATLVTAAFLTSVTAAIIGGGVKAGASIASGAASAVGAGASVAATAVNGDDAEGTLDYFVDTLFREGGATQGNQAGENASRNAEVARIFTNALWRNQNLPEDDARYIGRVIADRTDLSQQQAEQRVNETFTRLQTQLNETQETLKEAADDARKATAYASLWFFIALLLGAFVASYAATIGGRQRDL